ncbi:MAG: ATP-binding cassette domain-containing protein, partial [Ruminococcus sp.]|nr:ATP-binding cassette domain-containing protein [Ruminococcus sp.]
MIEVEHITKKFGDALVLSDVSFLIPDGEIYGLIGYNGVGKTTLLKIISGIYRPDSGRVKIQG